MANKYKKICSVYTNPIHKNISNCRIHHVSYFTHEISWKVTGPCYDTLNKSLLRQACHCASDVYWHNFSGKTVVYMCQLPYRIYVINPVFLFSDITSTGGKNTEVCTRILYNDIHLSHNCHVRGASYES